MRLDREENHYNGFTSFLAEFFTHFRTYVANFPIDSVEGIRVEYKDRVVIESNGVAPKGMTLREYFNIFPTLSMASWESFNHFEVRGATEIDDDVISVVFRPMTSTRKNDADHLQEDECPEFFLGWNAACTRSIKAGDWQGMEAEITHILCRLKDRLVQSFMEACTEKTLQLFEPVEEQQ